jgi:hypothetical protein
MNTERGVRPLLDILEDQVLKLEEHLAQMPKGRRDVVRYTVEVDLRLAEDRLATVVERTYRPSAYE